MIFQDPKSSKMRAENSSQNHTQVFRVTGVALAECADPLEPFFFEKPSVKSGTRPPQGAADLIASRIPPGPGGSITCARRRRLDVTIRRDDKGGGSGGS